MQSYSRGSSRSTRSAVRTMYPAADACSQAHSRRVLFPMPISPSRIKPALVGVGGAQELPNVLALSYPPEHGRTVLLQVKRPFQFDHSESLVGSESLGK